MSAMKNFFAKKGDRIDGSVAVIIVFSALVVSGVNVASATPAQAPSVTTQTVVTGGGSTGSVITVEGSAGITLDAK